MSLLSDSEQARYQYEFLVLFELLRAIPINPGSLSTSNTERKSLCFHSQTYRSRRRLVRGLSCIIRMPCICINHLC